MSSSYPKAEIIQD